MALNEPQNNICHSNKTSWFEFLLNDALLLQHLESKSNGEELS